MPWQQTWQHFQNLNLTCSCMPSNSQCDFRTPASNKSILKGWLPPLRHHSRTDCWLMTQHGCAQTNNSVAQDESAAALPHCNEPMRPGHKFWRFAFEPCPALYLSNNRTAIKLNISNIKFSMAGQQQKKRKWPSVLFARAKTNSTICAYVYVYIDIDIDMDINIIFF